MKSVVAVMHPKTTHNIHSYLLGRAWMAVSSVSSFVVRSFDNSNHNYYQSIYLFIHSFIHSLARQSIHQSTSSPANWLWTFTFPEVFAPLTWRLANTSPPAPPSLDVDGISTVKDGTILPPRAGLAL